jgi:hypothetical protein
MVIYRVVQEEVGKGWTSRRVQRNRRRETDNQSVDKARWSAGTLILNNSVVGTVESPHSGLWWAHGCLEDWQDVPLGVHKSEAQARKRVEDWVREHSEE